MVDNVTFSATRSPSTGLIWITAVGTNPTTGWTQEFRQLSNQEFEFLQEPPDGLVLQVIQPFVVNFMAIDVGQEIIKILYNSEHVEIEIYNATIDKEAQLNSWLSSGPLMIATESGIAQKVSGIENLNVARSCHQAKLGSFDVPFGCANWRNPLRAKRYTFYVRVCGPDEEEAKRAIEDCLAESSIAALLSAVLVPGGWSMAWGIFKAAFTACLSRRLGGAFSIVLWPEDKCV